MEALPEPNPLSLRDDLPNLVSLPAVEPKPGLLGQNQSDLIGFCRNMAILLEAGLPIEQALKSLQKHHRNGKFCPKFQKVLVQLHQDSLKGHPLSDALNRYPDWFDPLFCHIVQAGEQSGQLVFALQQLAEVLARTLQLRRKVLPIILYPCVAVLIAVLDAALFLGLALPLMVSKMPQSAAEPTGIWIGLNGLFSDGWVWVGLLIILGIGGIGCIGVLFFFRTRLGQELGDELVLAVPFMNETVRCIQSAYFIMGVFMAYNAGLPLSVAVRLGTASITNRSVRALFNDLETQLGDGSTLSSALADIDYLPEPVQDMIETGEHSGTLHKMLQLALNYLDQEIDYQLERMMAILKPLLLLMVALVIGGVLVTIYTVLFASIGQVLKQSLGNLL